jgi:hypothetical protein
MAIRFFCPFGHRLKVPEERAGKRGRCPICRQRFIVPEFALPDQKPFKKGPWASSESSITVGPTLVQPSAPAIEPPTVIGAPPVIGIGIDDRATEESIALPAAAGASSYIVPPPLPAVGAALAANDPTPRTLANGPNVVTRRRVAWAARASGKERESFDIAQATPRQLEMVYWLACLLPFAAIFCAAPAVPYVQFAGAPLWAQALIGLACLQFVYAAWLATVPDWSAVRVGIYLLAGVTILELLAALTLPLLPDASLAAAGLAGSRGMAAAWCALSSVVSGLACGAFRWLDERWRAGGI